MYSNGLCTTEGWNCCGDHSRTSERAWLTPQPATVHPLTLIGASPKHGQRPRTQESGTFRDYPNHPGPRTSAGAEQHSPLGSFAGNHPFRSKRRRGAESRTSIAPVLPVHLVAPTGRLTFGTPEEVKA